MKKLPKAKDQNILVQDLNDEVLIYDLIANKAFCLNQTSAIVFSACDGQTTFAELKRKHQFTDDLIFLALDELKRESLLEDEAYQSPFTGMTRREVAKKVGLATMIALPVISSLLAPTAAAAQSTCMGSGQSCTGTLSIGDCCSGTYCGINTCLDCTNSGVERCFSAAFNCQSIAFTCCSGSITVRPSVFPGCSGLQSCFCD